jgi:hypothetical protein
MEGTAAVLPLLFIPPFLAHGSFLEFFFFFFFFTVIISYSMFLNLVRAARTLLAKNLSFNVTQDDLKEVFEDAMEIRLVSQDGKSKGYGFVLFH